MKICYLTQTATDISDFYKEFFKGQDLFFVTFKKPNPNAVAFLPNSTWSDGRNALWEAVRGKYDYYVFIDDDLQFFKFNTPLPSSPLASYAYWKLSGKPFTEAYRLTEPAYFFERLNYYLERYKPEVAALSPIGADRSAEASTKAMRRIGGSFVKRLGYFDAQCTVLSSYGAAKILPYDTKISGWWSAQIPVYLYAFHVFASKAITLVELGVDNMNVQANYRPGYDGVKDTKKMLAAISDVTGHNYLALAGGTPAEAVDPKYGLETIIENMVSEHDKEDYAANYSATLLGLERLLHPGIKP